VLTCEASIAQLSAATSLPLNSELPRPIAMERIDAISSRSLDQFFADRPPRRLCDAGEH
jgi:hypothetical protein